MRTQRLAGLIPNSWIAVALIGLAYLATADSQSYGILALGSSIVFFGCFAAIYVAWGRDILRGPILFLILFILFHLGLIWTLGLGGDEPVFAVSATADLWVKTRFLAHAAWLVCLAAVVFTAVSVAMRPKDSRQAVDYPSDDPAGRRLGTAGLILELAGLVVLISTVVTNGGLALLTNGYLQFLESAQNASFAYSIWLIGIGACLSQVGTQGIRHLGLGLFVVYGLIFFPIGLRGSVLFPAVVLVATRALTGRRLRTLYLTLATVGALGLSSVIRLSRTGLEAHQDLPWYAPTLSTITELGFSLRPTVEALRWEARGLPHTMFVSFIAVPLRAVEKLTGWHGGSPADDMRLFNVKVNTLAGPIGGSPVAEGYDAAGTWGVMIIMVILAIVICTVSRAKTLGAISVGQFAVVMFPLVAAVRNSFAPVIVQIALGLAIVYLGTRRATATTVPIESVSVAG